MALLMFTQTLSGAIFLNFAETIFTNSLKSGIQRYSPFVNVEEVIAAGASAIRDVVAKDELAGVLLAYSKSIDRIFYMAAGLAACSFCFSWGMGWKDIRKKKQLDKE